MPRLTVPLTNEEAHALSQLACEQYRDIRLQAALIIITELKKLGYLNAAQQANGADDEQTARLAEEKPSN